MTSWLFCFDHLLSESINTTARFVLAG